MGYLNRATRIALATCSMALILVIPAAAADDAAIEHGWDFVERELLHHSGGIRANLLHIHPADDTAGVNHQMLSEYTGLALEYAVYAGDQAAFEQQFQFAEQVLQDHPVNLFGWRVDAHAQEMTNSSASLDDLRIVHGYLLGYAEWGDERYKEAALDSGNALLEHVVQNGVLSQGASWDEDGVYHSNPAWISYMHLPAMARLSEIDARWAPVLERQIEIVIGAGMGNGLFWQTYDLQTQQYEQIDTVSGIHQAIIGMHLAAAGQSAAAQPTLDFFKEAYHTHGQIAGAYTIAGAEAVPYEDISVYAIVAAMAHFQGDTVFEQAILSKIRGLQVHSSDLAPEHSAYAGAFVWGVPSRIYAFGQLQALRSLALSQWSPPVGGDSTPPSSSEEGGQHDSPAPPPVPQPSTPPTLSIDDLEKLQKEFVAVPVKKKKTKWQRQRRKIVVRCMERPGKKKIRRWKRKVLQPKRFKKANKRYSACTKRAKRIVKKRRLAEKRKKG